MTSSEDLCTLEQRHHAYLLLFRISRCLLPIAFNSKWLLVGTHAGNVYVVNLDTFTLSSYKIMWNNAIGMYAFVTEVVRAQGWTIAFLNRGKSTHPGVVVDLCQNPDDPTRVRTHEQG